MKADRSLTPLVVEELEAQATLHELLADDLRHLATGAPPSPEILEKAPLLQDWAPVRGIEQVILEGTTDDLVFRGDGQGRRTGHCYYVDGSRGFARDLRGWWRLGRRRQD